MKYGGLAILNLSAKINKERRTAAFPAQAEDWVASRIVRILIL